DSESVSGSTSESTSESGSTSTSENNSTSGSELNNSLPITGYSDSEYFELLGGLLLSLAIIGIKRKKS
ncbi:LPXTG cell wall anchor domain-containing protein, partial [Weissella muntiaci]